MTTSELFEEVRQITEQNIKITRERLMQLSEVQINWKKDQHSWSINEIFSHLNQYADYYHRAFKRKIEKTRFREPRENFISSPLGRSAWKSMKLGNARNIKRRFKAPRTYNPSLHPEMVKGNDLETFLNGQVELLGIFESAKAINIRKAKIAISISKIVRLRFGDALLFVVYHNERHLQQALNLLGHTKFPSA